MLVIDFIHLRVAGIRNEMAGVPYLLQIRRVPRLIGSNIQYKTATVNYTLPNILIIHAI